MSSSAEEMLRRLNLGTPIRRKHIKNLRNYRRPRVQKRFLKKWTWNDNNMPGIQEYFLASSDLSDHLTTKLMTHRQDKNTLMEEITLLATNQTWIEFAKNRFGDEDAFRIFHYSSHAMLITDLSTYAWMDCALNSNAITIKVHGTQSEIDHFIEVCSSKFEIAESYIEWMYSTNGESVNVPLRTDRTPIKEMYPFLGDESIEDFYDRYIESDASILVLIGPPGTGKTTFIRGLLQHTKSSAIVTYDAAILEKDYVFAQFIEGDTGVMVMEDADNFLRARSDGNSMMHRFLNVGDGLVTTKGKKLIFSTNLPSIRDIDSALIRPGRCFDIVHFDNLTKEQAEKLAKKAGVKLALDKDAYSIAEVFNGQIETEKKVSRRVGFV